MITYTLENHLEIGTGNCLQLLTKFEDNNSFVCPEDESVARSRRLRATDLFEGQTKVLLSEKPVYNFCYASSFFIKMNLDVITSIFDNVAIK